jgi:hypothetical protein
VTARRDADRQAERRLTDGTPTDRRDADRQTGRRLAGGTLLPPSTGTGKLRFMPIIRRRTFVKARAGIVLGGAKGATEGTIQVNETISRRPAEEIARALGVRA